MGRSKKIPRPDATAAAAARAANLNRDTHCRAALPKFPSQTERLGSDKQIPQHRVFLAGHRIDEIIPKRQRFRFLFRV